MIVAMIAAKPGVRFESSLSSFTATVLSHPQ